MRKDKAEAIRDRLHKLRAEMGNLKEQRAFDMNEPTESTQEDLFGNP